MKKLFKILWKWFKLEDLNDGQKEVLKAVRTEVEEINGEW
jgi:hypothetical protein